MDQKQLQKCAYCKRLFELDDWSDVYCSPECEEQAALSATCDAELVYNLMESIGLSYSDAVSITIS